MRRNGGLSGGLAQPPLGGCGYGGDWLCGAATAAGVFANPGHGLPFAPGGGGGGAENLPPPLASLAGGTGGGLRFGGGISPESRRGDGHG